MEAASVYGLAPCACQGWSLCRRAEAGMRENILIRGHHARSPGRRSRRGRARSRGFHPGWRCPGEPPRTSHSE